ncbi:hypothetical protein [Brumimicrobium aurantiacum]|nr:hypothetical protein [Brumimicrobium aurantiacum]
MVYSMILSQQNEQKKIYKLLKNHLEEIGGTHVPISNEIERFDIELTEKQLNKLDSYVDTTSAEYLAELELSNQLEKLSDLDRLVRMKDRGMDSIWWGNETDSVYVNRFEKMLEVDSLNFIQLVDFLPQIKTLRMGDFYLSRILKHMNYENFASIENQLLELVKGGVLDPWTFARAKDRAYYTEEDCSIYFVSPYSKTKVSTPLNKIKEKREEIGLSTYYRRPSFYFYITPGRMMKEPFDEYYWSVIKKWKE